MELSEKRAGSNKSVIWSKVCKVIKLKVFKVSKVEVSFRAGRFSEGEESFQLSVISQQLSVNPP
jgi:hypothetical protein